MDSSQSGEQRDQQHWPVSNVGLEQHVDMGAALGGEADSNEASGQENKQSHQRVVSDDCWSVVADAVTDGLHISKNVGDADHGDEDGEKS